MSWYEIMMGDTNLTIKPAKISINWICPRCLKEQDIIIQAANLIDGEFVTCQNVDICGSEQVYFHLSIEMNTSAQKGLDDRPLKNPATGNDDWLLFNQEESI